MFHPHRISAGIGYTMTVAVLVGALFAPGLLRAADFSSYRGLHFGMDLADASVQTGTRLTEARTVHPRPAMMQEMDWQLRPHILVDPLKSDPVKEGLLSFYNGELFRIVVTYDRNKIEGMTAEDMIEGISATYGPATTPKADIAYHSIYGETAPVVARWQDSDYSCDLVRTGDRSSFALILYSKRVDGLAQAADIEAVRLDAQEAPQREIDKQKKRVEDDQLALEKARSVNKLNFRP